MNTNCLEIGTIQAFLDGELSHVRSAEVSGHIADCDACALMLADAEEESALVFPALAREFDTLVPTQRLWNKINESITTERQSRPLWQKVWAFISTAFVSPTFAAAMALLLVVGVVGGLWLNKNKNEAGPIDSPTITRVTEKPAAATPSDAAPTAVTSSPTERTVVPATRSTPAIQRAAYRVEERPVVAVRKIEAKPAAATGDSGGYLAGEESYVKTIAALNKSTQGQKDGVLRPSERVAYERNMAVVDDTIKQMRGEVRKNPKNDAAKQILYTSYQNKIDLLNSVSQKEELVASLK